jgi:hypothetical protein
MDLFKTVTKVLESADRAKDRAVDSQLKKMGVSPGTRRIIRGTTGGVGSLVRALNEGESNGKGYEKTTNGYRDQIEGGDVGYGDYRKPYRSQYGQYKYPNKKRYSKAGKQYSNGKRYSKKYYGAGAQYSDRYANRGRVQWKRNQRY